MAEDMIIKSSSGLIIKNLDVDRGELKAYVTTFGNADLVGDVMDPGVLDDFIEGFKNIEGASLPMLWEHNRENIIGEWTEFESDSKGVIGTGRLYKGVSRADDARVLLSEGAVNSVSIGFVSKDYDEIKGGGRLFKSIELRETSIVATPANPMAQIVSAKNEDGEIDIRQLEKTLRDAGLSRNEAKAFISAGKDALREEVIKTDAKEDVMAELLSLYKGN